MGHKEYIVVPAIVKQAQEMITNPLNIDFIRGGITSEILVPEPTDRVVRDHCLSADTDI